MTYIFHRQDTFYVLDLENDLVAIENGKSNPGTLRVENALTGEIVWSTPVADANFCHSKIPVDTAMVVNIPNLPSDEVLAALKTRYFRLAKEEVIGSTPKITDQVDHLENAIKQMTATKP